MKQIETRMNLLVQPSGYSMSVVETDTLREGALFLSSDPWQLVVGTRKPTEYEAIVMDGIAKAHPWLRDPLRMGAETWRLIQQVAAEQGYELIVRKHGRRS